MTTFGSLIRSYRLRAGLGLRTFAALVDERASIVSAIESGRRAPWRSSATLHRVAEVLGLAESSNLWQKILELAHAGVKTPMPRTTEGALAWWWRSEEAPELDSPTLAELADFVGATIDLDLDLPQAESQKLALAPLTELGIEWRVRRLLGRREVQVAAAPVDVEAALENEAGVRLEIVPGLIPRFSVQACVVATSAGLTLFVDRIVADSRPIASYRHLLALCFAPSALWQPETLRQAETTWHAAHFRRLQSEATWPGLLRDCERFALAMLLPANPVLAAAETAYIELIQQQDLQQQGWLEIDDAARALRNRLAEQFAVPTALVHRRLVGWPCHLYGRIAQALAAEEPTLPPLDWLVPEKAPQQRTLFELDR